MRHFPALFLFFLLVTDFFVGSYSSGRGRAYKGKLERSFDFEANRKKGNVDILKIRCRVLFRSCYWEPCNNQLIFQRRPARCGKPTVGKRESREKN